MIKILVTGATGFIGNYVVQELLKKNCKVIASSFSEEKAKASNWFPNVRYVPFDFSNFKPEINYFQFFEQPDLMIHLAWEGLPNYKSSFHTEVNLPRQLLFLENLLQNGLRDLVVTGTCFEYGMREGELSEDMVSAPANPYAIAKDDLRKLLERLQMDIPFVFRWIRLFYMYGKGQNANSLFSQLQKALDEGIERFNMSGGEQLRDYMPVELVAANIVKIALQQQVTGIINCCSGKPVSVRQLVVDYLREKNASIKLNLGFYPYADYEPMAFWGNTKKLKQII